MSHYPRPAETRPTAIKKEKLLQAPFSFCYFHPRETKVKRRTSRICQEKKPKRNIFQSCQLKKSQEQEWFFCSTLTLTLLLEKFGYSVTVAKFGLMKFVPKLRAAIIFVKSVDE